MLKFLTIFTQNHFGSCFGKTPYLCTFEPLSICIKIHYYIHRITFKPLILLAFTEIHPFLLKSYHYRIPHSTPTNPSTPTKINTYTYFYPYPTELHLKTHPNYATISKEIIKTDLSFGHFDSLLSSKYNLISE